ncbi:MAG: hypothetical protein ACO3EZ_19295 [Prochlorotrichaceae cyanobacterium]
MVQLTQFTPPDPMTNVYAVIGGFHYEGQSFDSLRLFDCKSAAEAYHDHLLNSGQCDYALIDIRTIDPLSALDT